MNRVRQDGPADAVAAERQVKHRPHQPGELRRSFSRDRDHPRRQVEADNLRVSIRKEAGDVPWPTADLDDRAGSHEVDERGEQGAVQWLGVELGGELSVVRPGHGVVGSPDADSPPPGCLLRPLPE